MQEHYIVPDTKIVSLQTGLLPHSPRFAHAGNEEIAEALRRRGIPLDKKLIFSVGRGVPYKGFDDLITSFAKLSPSMPDIHLVFIAPPHKNETGITHELDTLIREMGIEGRCTPIYDLDMELPRLICQWHLTSIVAQLSHREPFGLVPEEVRLWAHENEGPVVVASDLDGFKEQITNGEDGFLVDPADHSAVAATFRSILTMSSSVLKAVRINGRARALRDYNYAEAVSESITALLEKEHTQ